MAAPTQTTPPTPQTPAPLSGQDAYAVVFQRAYVPAWRAKLAQYGLQPAPEQEQAMLEASAELRRRYEAERTKLAAAGDPVLAEIRSRLGLPAAEAAQAKVAEAQSVKQAAVNLSFDPDIAHAVLCMLNAEN